MRLLYSRSDLSAPAATSSRRESLHSSGGTGLKRTCASILVSATLTGGLLLPTPALASSSVQKTLASAADASAEVVLRALSLLGVNYRWGGNTPATGLDCSGLVKLVFQETVGLALPRRSDDMSRFGTLVALNELQPGDLVFFNTMRFSYSHVGIYIGEGKFVHAPSSGGFVRVENLDKDYWMRRYDGARRLLATLPAESESLNFQSLTGTTGPITLEPLVQPTNKPAPR